MRVLGEHLGVDRSQMMAFGDTYNDREMLQAVVDLTPLDRHC
jgi:hydroxymethylpyrimidine pyrophosphatase-like HAD family hydrolase